MISGSYNEEFKPQVGDKVQLVEEIERYPHFVAGLGMTGKITDVEFHDDFGTLIYVKIDQHLEDCEEWENCLQFVDYEEFRETIRWRSIKKRK